MLRKILLMMWLVTCVSSEGCDSCDVRQLPIPGLEHYDQSSACDRKVLSSTDLSCEVSCQPNLQLVYYSTNSEERIYLKSARFNASSSSWIGTQNAASTVSLSRPALFGCFGPIRCGPYVDTDGVQWPTRCNMANPWAVCNEDRREEFCTCPNGYDGEFCEFLKLSPASPTRCMNHINDKGIEFKTKNDIFSSENIHRFYRCNEIDPLAVCNDNIKLPFCSCSSGYSGPTCGYRTDHLERIKKWTDHADFLMEIIKSAQKSPAVFEDILPFIYSYFTQKELMNMGWEQTDLIDSLDFELKEIDTKIAFTNTFDVARGNCYTFNFANQTNSINGLYNARFAGKTRDFSIILKLNPFEQIAWIDRSSISVYIHAPGTPPAQGAMYSLKAAAADAIKLQKKITKLVSRCITSVKELKQSYYEKGDYTTEGCYSACYQDRVMATCGCMDPRYEKSATASYCVLKHFECIKDILRQFGEASSWPSCKCPVPCYQEEYTLVATKSTLAFKTRNCGNTTKCPDKPQTEARLKISMNSLEAQVYVEMPKMTLSEVLAQFGSQIGLIGISIVGLIEFILLCYQLGKGKHGEEWYDNDYDSQVEGLTFARLLIDFANWSTVVCLNKIVNSTKWLALFFTAVFITMCICLVFFSVQCTIKFFMFPSAFELSTSNEPMEFPRFSFCNENPMKRSVVDSLPVYANISRLLRQYELIESNQTSPDDFGLMTKTESRRQILHKAQVMLRLLTAQLSDADRIAASYLFTELVTECTFAGVTCSSADFSPFLHPEYGVCYAFKRNRTITRAVQKDGLKMLFTVNQDSTTEGVSDFLPTTESAAIWGVVYDKGEFADFTNDGFKMGFGSRVFVGLSRTTYSRLDKPYGHCAHDAEENYGAFNYTVQSCQHECLQRLAKDKCGCVDPLYKKADNDTYCSTATDMLCLVMLTHEIATATSEGGRKLCWCKPACLDSVYVESVSSGSFPSEHYNVAAGTVEQRRRLLEAQGGGRKANGSDEANYDNPAKANTTAPCLYVGPPASAHDLISNTDYCKEKYKEVYTDRNLIALVGYPCTSVKPCGTCVFFSQPPSNNSFICKYPSYPSACPNRINSAYLKEIMCPEFFDNFDFIPIGTGVPNISKWWTGAVHSDSFECRRSDKSDNDDCQKNPACDIIPTSEDITKLIGTEAPLAPEFLASLTPTTTPCQLADLAFKAARKHYKRIQSTPNPSHSPTTTPKPKFTAELPGLGSCELANRNFDTAEDCIRWYQRNGLMMHLHFKTMEEYTYTQVPTYPFISLISDYAGHAGLWLGISMVTVIEIVCLIITCLAFLCCGRKITWRPENKIDLDDLDTARSARYEI